MRTHTHRWAPLKPYYMSDCVSSMSDYPLVEPKREADYREERRRVEGASGKATRSVGRLARMSYNYAVVTRLALIPRGD